MQEMLGREHDIQFHFCQEPLKAAALAAQLSPTVILQDLAMPGMDGLSLLKSFRQHLSTRETPIAVLSSREDAIIKAQAFALGATDYMVKLPDRIELIARIRRHSQAHVTQLQRTLAHEKLVGELDGAAQYVRSLIPAPFVGNRVRIDWRFAPSAQLGGDAFGYHWLDDHSLAIYLLDVSGHGIESSLLAVSVLNTLSRQTLPGADFYDPHSVLRNLNDVYRMDTQGQHFLTLWYGVYNCENRELCYSGAGHPPPLLFSGADCSSATIQAIHSSGPPIGVIEKADFSNAIISIPSFGEMLLYSDGPVEVGQLPDGGAYQTGFNQFVADEWRDGHLLEKVLQRGWRLNGGGKLKDDCSLMQIDFL